MSLILLLPNVLPRSFASTDSLWLPNLKGHVQGIKELVQRKLHGAHDSFRKTEIPNIVHFVHLLKFDTNQIFDFPFRQLISIYSAQHYLQPEILYVHTNVPEHQIEERIKSSTSPYTRAVSNLPRVKFNYHAAPSKTLQNCTVDLLPNQSDFVRTDVLSKYGGIYLDDDPYILRDLEPFPRMGFENIFGQRDEGNICPAVIMATKGNKMMKIYHDLQDIIFDGTWANHAVGLLTTLTHEFAPHPYQVLINPRDVFFPYSWKPKDIETVYKINSSESVVPIINNQPIENATDFIEHFILWPPNIPKETWQVDWRLAYILHGWNHALEREMKAYKKQGKADEIFGKFKDVTPEYVLAQNSNLARAVYPEESVSELD